MDKKQSNSTNINSGYTLNLLLRSRLINNCAHILYMFTEYNRYINNAVEYIAEGLDHGHTIVLVENEEFISTVTNCLLRLGYSETDIDAITKVNQDNYYTKNKNFDAKYCFHSLVTFLQPYINSEKTVRLWGQVFLQDGQVSELREYECMCDEFFRGKNITSVCAYNALITPAYIQNEMMKVHEYFMTDEKVDLSPFYHKSNVTSISQSERTRLQNIEIENSSLKKKNDQLLKEKAQQIATVQNLHQAKISAENANKMKNSFLSQISHDLRTPLNTILGYTQILLLEKSNDETTHNLVKIYNSSMDLLKLIEEIIDFSAIEAGKISLNMENIHVKSFVDNCVNSIFEKNSENLIIKTDFIRDDLYIVADKLRLHQVITNLLSNAVKYNKDNGEVSISVDYYNLKEEVKISVEDTGYGIAQDELSSIFEPFYRTKLSIKKWRGTGVGLAIVSKLTNIMNGSYGVKSEEGKGSTFYVSFKGVLEEKLTSTNISPLSRKQHFASLNNMKILYIEDNLDNVEVLSSMLQVIGNITVLFETTGIQGYSRALDERPNLILLDLHLPDVSGFSILTKLKTHTETKDIPVIIISAEALESTMKQAKNEGAHKYLTKPVSMKTLQDALLTIQYEDNSIG